MGSTIQNDKTEISIFRIPDSGFNPDKIFQVIFEYYKVACEFYKPVNFFTLASVRELPYK